MKVKCINTYFDTQLKKEIKTGDTLEVADDRATVLINAKVAEALTTPEVATETAPKKRASKKVNK